MANQIIGTTDYRGIKDKRYFNGTPDNMTELADKLKEAGIPFSGRITDTKGTITASGADYARVNEVFIEMGRNKVAAEAANREIIGNTQYRFIRDKQIISGEADIIRAVSERLKGEYIPHSGVIDGSTARITVSGKANREIVEKYIEEAKHPETAIDNTAYTLTNIGTDYPKYILVSDKDGQSYTDKGSILEFNSADEAVTYAQKEYLFLSNTENELDMFYSIDEGAAEYARRENALESLLKEIGEQQSKNPVDHFKFNEDGITWTQFSAESITVHNINGSDIIAAHEAYNISKGNYSAFFDSLAETSDSIVIDRSDDDFYDVVNEWSTFRDGESISLTNGLYNEISKFKNKIEDTSETVRNQKDNERLKSLTEQIKMQKQRAVECIQSDNHNDTLSIINSLTAMQQEAAEVKRRIQDRPITADDVQSLRSIEPKRKSVQNMLEQEVAQTTKFEAMLGSEMGAKFAYEMRNSNNEWRNDDTQTVNVINISERSFPQGIADLRRSENISKINRGTFVNKDTGIEIAFGRNAIGETIAKAIQDDKRHRSVEARVAALYQMQEIIENAICFDSEISDYDPITSKNKSPNTLFMHKMYGVMNYKGEPYLADLTIEEMYSRNSATHNLEATSNKVHSFKDIKITPMKPGLNPRDQMQNGIGSVSLGATISIAQLYDFVKTYDEDFFENPSAVGRAERVEEINNEIAFDDAKAKFDRDIIIADFRQKTEQNFNPIGDYTAADIENMVKDYISDVFSRSDISAAVNEVIVAGSRSRGLERDDSDIDIIVEYTSADDREDSIFNLLNDAEEKSNYFDNSDTLLRNIDINPIRAEETGTLEDYLPRAEEYLDEKKNALLTEYINSNIEYLLRPSLAFDEQIAVTDEFFNFEKAWHNVGKGIKELAERYRNGEDIRADLARHLQGSSIEKVDGIKNHVIFNFKSDETNITISSGNISKEVALEEAGEYYLRYLKDTFREMQLKRVRDYPELKDEVDKLLKRNDIAAIETEPEQEIPDSISVQDRIHDFASAIGVNEEMLRDMVEKHLTEANINEFGKLDKLKGTVDRETAKPFLDKLYGEDIPNHKVNMYIDKAISEFILSGGESWSKEATAAVEEKRITLYKVGDFYEMYNKDAEIAADVLDLQIASRNGLPMTGFPNFSLDAKSDKLKSAGYTILIENDHSRNPSFNQSIKEEQEIKETPEPHKLTVGDIFRDKMSNEWEVTSLTGIYTDECTVRGDRGKYFVEQNISHSQLLDSEQYTLIKSAEPEQSADKDGNSPVENKTTEEIFAENGISADNPPHVFPEAEAEIQAQQVEQFSFFGTPEHHVSMSELSANTKLYDDNTEKAETKTEEKAGKTQPLNYRITDDNYGAIGGDKARYRANVDAIRTLKAIESENRNATAEEQEILAKYVGWGGIPNAFDSNKSDWANEYNQLKELLTTEEYSAAKESTLNAHYTTPVVIGAIYSALENMGFEGGKVLEPSMGIGNFIGAMPEKIREKSEISGVELDSITGRIAKQLYQGADIAVKGFEETKFKNNSFDVAVSNVPFGDYKLHDPEYRKNNFLIHDYFFAKALDKVRPGGIVAFVTSKGTLDKNNPDVRKYLAERAELLGAIRLPNNAFKANAGTEVTADIIFLQKRDNPISIEGNPPDWITKDTLANGIAVNSYFAKHPEMILGEMAEGNKMYGNQANATTCNPIEGANLKEQLATAIQNIRGVYTPQSRSEKVEVKETVIAPPDSKNFSFIVQNDNVYFRRETDEMELYKGNADNIAKIKALVDLKESLHNLFDLQIDNADGNLDEEITTARKVLNDKYDNYSQKYGLISDKKTSRLMHDDINYQMLTGLEIFDNNGNYTGKAGIFTTATIKPRNIPSHVENAKDALILSLSEKFKVDMDFMRELTGMSEDALVSELEGEIYCNPEKNMQWESADEYLTGNVCKKLLAAETAGLEKNAEALRAVMPQKVEAADIKVKLGSAWINPEYISQFVNEALNVSYFDRRKVKAAYVAATDKWKVERPTGMYLNSLMTDTYGTPDRNAFELIEDCLNMQSTIVRERVKDEYGNDVRDEKGNYVLQVNHDKTMLAQEKQKQLQSAFQDWIFKDPDRRENLENVFNEKFNSIRLREYDGSHLNFVGMNDDITLKEHQKNAIARGLSGKNVLLAHEVGAGKTFEMTSIAMEGKRLGLHNKPLFAVPNSLTAQWAAEFYKLYPNANILVATEADFAKKNRRDLYAKIALNDFDAIIIGHSQLDKLSLSYERQEMYIQDELSELEDALLAAKEDDPQGKSFSVKEVQKALKKMETKLKDVQEKIESKADDFVDFEKLGIDKLFIDESQNYKNLGVHTKMHNVAGIGTKGSDKAFALYQKCRYFNEITGNNGICFASGTPISNSMSEMYSLMRYLQPDKLEEMGINSFDQWASTFGETTTAMELSPEGNGKYQMKTRFAKFDNLPELMTAFKECADVKTADSLNLDRPDAEYHNVVTPPTRLQQSLIKELGDRATAIRRGNVDPRENNMLKITNDGRKIGLDQRCIDPNLPDDPNSKVNTCVANVFDIYQKTTDSMGTQLIFCDLATPQPPVNDNTYTLYKEIEGEYVAYYSAKLSERDTPDKLFDKLQKGIKVTNDEVSHTVTAEEGDILVLSNANPEEALMHNTAFVLANGKTENAAEKLADLKKNEFEPFESSRRYCVYDDIKEKLIAKGIPEKEIAFIHDAETAKDKQALYQKMNTGELRVLIGSTSKCGAGMNAQKHMVALHDLDAPMRPSDMQQRHGRIVRQGNENAKVDIYRYTTDKTFDAYLYQMLENKQKFISQIMTDKTPVRSCEDVDEISLDYAEVKALCSGNPLIKQKIDLETEVTKHNLLKSQFKSQLYRAQDKAYKVLPIKLKNHTMYRDKLIEDKDFIAQNPPLKDENGKDYYPIEIMGKTYTDKEEAGQAIRDAINKNPDILEGKTRVIGSYRGFELSASRDAMKTDSVTNKIDFKVALRHSWSHYTTINMDSNVRASGNIIRLDNALSNMDKLIDDANKTIDNIATDIDAAIEAANAVFPREAELAEKEKLLSEINSKLMDISISTNDNGKELYARLSEQFPEVMQGSESYVKYTAPLN